MPGQADQVFTATAGADESGVQMGDPGFGNLTSQLLEDDLKDPEIAPGSKAPAAGSPGYTPVTAKFVEYLSGAAGPQERDQPLEDLLIGDPWPATPGKIAVFIRQVRLDQRPQPAGELFPCHAQ